jgi:hypothetical protein
MALVEEGLWSWLTARSLSKYLVFHTVHLSLPTCLAVLGLVISEAMLSRTKSRDA